MKDNETKYIKLLLERCLNFDKSKSLLISYDKINKNFVNNVVEYAKKLGVDDIYLDEDDINTTKEKLENLTLDEIEKDSYFNKSIWDKYAKKDASFLMLETEFPNELDGVDPLKISKAKYVNRTTRELFRKKEATNEIPWCIAALPNEIWAKSIFPWSPPSWNCAARSVSRCFCPSGSAPRAFGLPRRSATFWASSRCSSTITAAAGKSCSPSLPQNPQKRKIQQNGKSPKHLNRVSDFLFYLKISPQHHVQKHH